MTAQALAWHYTTAMGFLGIVHKRAIRVSTHDVPEKELPVAWFSRNPMLERTMAEMRWKKEDGTLVAARNIRELRLLCQGLYRIGVPSDALLSYPALLKQAKIGLIRRKKLESIAKQVGALPFEWMGSLTPVVLTDDPPMQSFDGTRWVDLARQGCEDYVLAEQQRLAPEFELLMSSWK